jgi:type I restriction enzyme S subunit
VLLERALQARRAVSGKDGIRQREPSGPDLRDVPDAPAAWAWASLDQLADVVGGITKDAKRQGSGLVNVPYLRVANVQRGFLDLRVVTRILIPPAKLDELRLQPGDVLFTEGGDRDKLGRGWVWEGQIDPCVHQNHIFRARLALQEIEPRFVSWYGNTSGRWFERQGKQTTNLASINLRTLRSLPVPLPPAGEQARIRAEVERLLSVVDAAEAVISRELVRAATLRETILARAFAGDLPIPGAVDKRLTP